MTDVGRPIFWNKYEKRITKGIDCGIIAEYMFLRMLPMATTFSNRAGIAKIEPPTDKPHLEAWHDSIPGFGVRIYRRHKKTGLARQVYIARIPDPQEGESEKPIIGEVGMIAYEDAMTAAGNRRKRARDEKTSGIRKFTLRQAYDYYLAARGDDLRDATKEGYEKRMRYLEKWGDDPIDKLDAAFWRERFTHLSATSGQATAVGVVRVVSAIYNMLLDDQYLEHNPVRSLKKRDVFKRQKPRRLRVPRQAMPALWDWLHTKAHVAVRDFALWALFTGFRRELVRNLLWQKLSEDGRSYLVHPEERGNKSKREIAFPLPDYLVQTVVLPRKKARHNDFPWIIESNKRIGQQLRDIRGSLKTAEKMIGCKLGPHILRRTFGSVADEILKDRLKVARLLTHTVEAKQSDEEDVPASTGLYLISDTETLRRDINRVAEGIVKFCTDPTWHPEMPLREDLEG